MLRTQFEHLLLNFLRSLHSNDGAECAWVRWDAYIGDAALQSVRARPIKTGDSVRFVARFASPFRVPILLLKALQTWLCFFVFV